MSSAVNCGFAGARSLSRWPANGVSTSRAGACLPAVSRHHQLVTPVATSRGNLSSTSSSPLIPGAGSHLRQKPVALAIHIADGSLSTSQANAASSENHDSRTISGLVNLTGDQPSSVVQAKGKAALSSKEEEQDAFASCLWENHWDAVEELFQWLKESRLREGLGDCLKGIAVLVLTASLVHSPPVAAKAAGLANARDSLPLENILQSGEKGDFLGATVTGSQLATTVAEENVSSGVLEEEEVKGPVVPEELVLEAWNVVNDTFLDARDAGWTKEKWETVKTNFLKRKVSNLLEARSVVSTMVAGLKDPFSRYITPDQFARLAKYDITGVGLNIGDLPGRDGVRRPLVVGIVLESPAYKAGIRQGDELIAVDGQDVTKMSSFDVASLIQGTKGSPVTIAISRERGKPVPANSAGSCTASGLCSFSVLRAADAPATPVVYRLEKRRLTPLTGPQEDESQATIMTGYIRVKEFNAVAKRDLAEAVKRLQAAGAQSLVLDLQDNPGGLVQAGVESAKLFLYPGSTVVYTQARGGAGSERGVQASGDPLTEMPLTVLVNGRTASASEIVAGALHDNCRAVLVGTTTFGKGLIQSVYELQDGSGLILTVGKYVTPAHQDIDGNGIKPDFRRAPGMDIAQHRLNACTQPAQE